MDILQLSLVVTICTLLTPDCSVSLSACHTTLVRHQQQQHLRQVPMWLCALWLCAGRAGTTTSALHMLLNMERFLLAAPGVLALHILPDKGTIAAFCYILQLPWSPPRRLHRTSAHLHTVQ
jgi:hypothetical protein